MTKLVKNDDVRNSAVEVENNTKRPSLGRLSPNQGVKTNKNIKLGFTSNKDQVSKDISIDSLKIRIPKSVITIIDNNLGKEMSLVSFEDEELNPYEIFKKTSLKHKTETGITTRFHLGKQGRRDIVSEECLTIMVNAKCLKERYFEGITKNNIEDVYNYIISLKVVDFCLFDFLKGECTDVDFKSDFYRPFNQYQKEIKEISKKTKPRKERDKGSFVTRPNKNNLKNCGIEFNKRISGTAKNPFFKIYHKEGELKSKSFDFWSNYLSQKFDIDNLVRREITIKNKAHFKSIGVSSNKLIDILDISKELKEKTIINGLKNNLEDLENEILGNHLTDKEKPLSGKDRIIVNAMIAFKKSGLSSSDIFIILEGNNSISKVQKSRDKKKLLELWNNHIENGRYCNGRSSIVDYIHFSPIDGEKKLSKLLTEPN